MSPRSRKEYIKAVKCLQSKPPRSSKQEVPGARSRFDDFSSQHIKLTPYVHFSVRSTPALASSQQINLNSPLGSLLPLPPLFSLHL
jgi:hypothetical protein